MSPPEGPLHERFARHGQAHVFRFWEALDAGARRRLAHQAEGLDLEALERGLARARAPHPLPGDDAPGDLEAPRVARLPEHGGDPAGRARALEAARDWLAAGRVALLVVAGGQGSRLGFDGPKGAFPIGPVSGRSLFALQAQRLRGLARRHGCAPPWLVMTSDATDAATRALFAREGCFGLEPGNVIFFRQASLPVVDAQGRLLLEAPDRIAEAPDGHGGVMPALVRSGALDAVEERGIQVLFHYQVDNPLLPLAEPSLLGFHRLEDAEMSSLVVARRVPEERMGSLARGADGRVRVIEYSEIREPLRSAREPDGSLRLWAGSIGVHAYTPAFVRRIARDAERTLPLHAAHKRVACLDARGARRRPEAPNALKLERFVFDALPHAARVALVEARREDVYEPVKNPRGGESPESSRRALSALYRRWLEAAGVEAPPAGVPLEIDHARIDGPDDLRAQRLRAWHEAGDAVRAGDGARG